MALLLETLLKERLFAEIFGISVACARKWRRQGVGPKWIRIGGPGGRAIRYRLSDLEAYIKENTVGTNQLGGDR